MTILGLLLLVGAAGLAVDVVVQNASSIRVEAVGETFSLTPGWLFVAGVATGVVALLGISLLVSGVSRARRRRAAFVASRSSVQELQAERDRLAGELERERTGRTAATARLGHDDRPVAHDEEPAVIDLADERRPEPASPDYVAASGPSGRGSAADRRERAESGRHGLFHRRR